MPDDRKETQVHGDPNAHKHGFVDNPNSTAQANELQEKASTNAQSQRITSVAEKAVNNQKDSES